MGKRTLTQEAATKTQSIVLWKSAKARAKKKDLDFDIEVSDIIIPQLEMPVIKHSYYYKVGTGSNFRRPNAPSLDRIKNHLGYIKGNILVVSWRANFIKGDASIAELELLLTNLKSIV